MTSVSSKWPETTSCLLIRDALFTSLKEKIFYIFCFAEYSVFFTWRSTWSFVLWVTVTDCFPYQYDRDRLWSLPDFARNVLPQSGGFSSCGMVVVPGCCRLNFMYFLRLFSHFMLDFFLILQLLGICTLPWSGVALLSVLVWSKRVG